MYKKALNLLIIVFLTITNFSVFIYAEDDEDLSDFEKCKQGDSQACKAYVNESTSIIADIRKEIYNAQSSKDEALKLAQEYAIQAESLQAEISSLKEQITTLEDRINELILQIETNEAKVEALNNRVKNRMVNTQKTMHFSGYLNFILGSQSFSDMLRRIYGINSLLSKDKSDREEYLDIITQLSNDKEELDVSKKDLDEKYDVIVEKQAKFIVMQEYYEEEAMKIQDELDAMTAEMDSYYDSFDDLQEILNENGISTNVGFVSAVHGSSIVEGVWKYSDDFEYGGRWHLGVDYAARRGTQIHAPAGGVIIRADASCGEGYLGSYCGKWISGGGNQVYLMAEVNGSIYGFMFFHLSSVNVEYGDFVMQDDVIGTVGSSGSSTGPHCHIEMYYLGEGRLGEYLSMNWNATFSVGRGQTAYNNRCAVSGPPCILDPEDYLPG